MNTDTIKPILKQYGLSIPLLIALRFAFDIYTIGNQLGLIIVLLLCIGGLYLLLPTIPLIKKGIALTGAGGFLLEVFYILFITFFLYSFNAIWERFLLSALLYIVVTLSVILYPLIQNNPIVQQNMDKSQAITNIVKYFYIVILGISSLILYVIALVGPYDGYELWAIAIFTIILLLKNTVPDRYSSVSNTDSNIPTDNKSKVFNPIKRIYIISFILVFLVNVSIVILFGLELFYNGCPRPDPNYINYFGCGFAILGLILAIPAVPTLLIFLVRNLFLFWKYKEKVNVFTRYVLFISSGFAILGILFVGLDISDTGVRVSSYSEIILPLIFIKGVIELYYLIKIRKILKLESSHTEVQVPEVIGSNQDVDQIEKINTF